MIYCGIGSRETPDDILGTMEDIAGIMAGLGWTLRSGMAGGADQAFYVGALLNKGKCEIYLPWAGFNSANDQCMDTSKFANLQEAMEITAQFHPAWDKCSEGAKKLHTRNVYQIAGKNLDTPATCVICWTKNGKDVGGTGQAIRMARHLEIPVFNLFHDDAIDQLNKFVEQQIKSGVLSARPQTNNLSEN